MPFAKVTTSDNLVYVASGSVVDSLVDSLDSVVVSLDSLVDSLLSVVVSLDSVVVSLVFSDSVVVSVVVTVSSGVTSDEFGVEDGCSLVDGVLQPAKRSVEATDKTNNDFYSCF